MLADRKHHGRQPFVRQFDAFPDGVATPEAKHLQIDCLTGFLMHELHIGHALADAREIENRVAGGRPPGAGQGREIGKQCGDFIGKLVDRSFAIRRCIPVGEWPRQWAA